MFYKITAARAELARLHQGDPSYKALDAVFGAFQDTLDDVNVAMTHLHDLLHPPEPENPIDAKE